MIQINSNAIIPEKRIKEKPKAALWYLRKGLSVVPLHNIENGVCTCQKGRDCKNPGKHSRVRWKEFQIKLPKEKEVKEWWQRWPRANIGIITGKVSGIIVLDLDVPNGPRTIEEKKLDIPATIAVKTGGGGYHYYFKYPGFECKNFAGKSGTENLPGVDFRGDGGFIVAPPSDHVKGKYEWLLNEGLVEAPPWLLKKIEEQGTSFGKLKPDEWKKQIPQGKRNNELARRAGSLIGKGHSQEATIELLRSFNKEKCNPPLQDGEVKQIVKSIKRKHQKEKQETKGKKKPVIQILKEVQEEEVPWLWWPYIPRKKVTIMEGDPGVGKTFLALKISAAISNGQSLPDQEGNVPKQTNKVPGKVLYLTAEDGIADTLKPRLKKMGAEENNIHILKGWENEEEGTKGLVTLKDMAVIIEALKRVKPDLVIIDPIQGYLGQGVDMNKAEQVRPLLSELSTYAEIFNSSILCIRHLAKTNLGRSIYRGLGSIDFSAAARSILMVGVNPDNPHEKVLIQIKNSLDPVGQSLAFELTSNGFNWKGITDLKAPDLSGFEQGREERTALEEAEDFLKECLLCGPQTPKDVKKQAKEMGIAEKTLRRAREKLGVKTEKIGQYGWEWYLPAQENFKGKLDNMEINQEYRGSSQLAQLAHNKNSQEKWEEGTI